MSACYPPVSGQPSADDAAIACPRPPRLTGQEVALEVAVSAAGGGVGGGGGGTSAASAFVAVSVSGLLRMRRRWPLLLRCDGIDPLPVEAADASELLRCLVTPRGDSGLPFWLPLPASGPLAAAAPGGSERLPVVL